MSPVRVLIIVIAAIAAIGLAFVMRGAFAPKPAALPPPAPVVAEKPMTRVLTAKKDLAIGARVQAGDLGWQDWPADALNPAFITDGAAPTLPSEKPTGVAKATASAGEMIGGAGPLQTYEGAIVREPMLTGEPVMARKLVRDGEGGFLSVILDPGKRAIAVAVTVESGVAGFILPGDRVDVLQTQEMDLVGGSGGGAAPTVFTRPKNNFAIDTVLTNIRVLAIDQITEPEKGAKSLIGATATLEVGPREAELLMRSKSQGSLVLALRALADSGQPAGATGRGDGSVETKAPQANIVRVHRGGSTETVGVRQ